MQPSELKPLSGPGRIALRGVRVRSRLSSMSQKTVVEQVFANQEDHALEAVYTFPLTDGAAVCGFEVFTCDRCLTGAIEDCESALARHEDATGLADTAFMLIADRSDVFTARVGSLKPREPVTI